MDLYMIDSTIEELENSETNFSNCEKLATLYIIKEHYKQYPPVLRGLYDDVEEELNDIAPQYKTYCDIKRNYQLGTGSKEAVIKSAQAVCREINEFINILYSSTDMKEERDELKKLLINLYNKYTR